MTVWLSSPQMVSMCLQASLILLAASELDPSQLTVLQIQSVRYIFQNILCLASVFWRKSPQGKRKKSFPFKTHGWCWRAFKGKHSIILSFLSGSFSCRRVLLLTSWVGRGLSGIINSLLLHWTFYMCGLAGCNDSDINSQCDGCG